MTWTSTTLPLPENRNWERIRERIEASYKTFAMLEAATKETLCRSQRVRFVVVLAFEATVGPTIINMLKV